METTKDNAAQQLRIMLTGYAVELANETPVLSRYTDVFPRPDGLGGYAETERDRAWRNNLKYPHTVTDLESCITGLTQFKDAQTEWDNLRGELLKNNYGWLAKELACRRERRNANLDRMISAANALAPAMPTVEEILSVMSAEDEKPQNEPKYDIATALQRAEIGTLDTPPTLPRETNDRKSGILDFRDWEHEATKFDDDTAGDIAYIEKAVAEMMVAAFADVNGRLAEAGGKPFLTAAAIPTTIPQNALDVLVWLNEQIGIIPPAKVATMSVPEIVDAFERHLDTVKQMLIRLDGIVVKPPRTDKGNSHKRTARGWQTQKEVAADFSKQAKKIGGRLYGKVTEATVKDWENRYPDETKRERKSGYHAGLRNEPNPTPETKMAYYEAAANWNDYWRKHNAAFLAWLKTNPQGDHATFLKTWERPGKTVHRNDTDKTMRYGADTSLPDALDSGDFDNET